MSQGELLQEMSAKFLKRNHLTSRAGFSLIEVIVAIGIFSFAILGLAVGTITITRANGTSQFHTNGTNMAQDILEQLKAQPYIGVNSGTDTISVQGKNYVRTWVVTENLPATFKRIDLTVSWTDYAPRSVTVSGAISR
jgi:prepilin-type N-terminal cleavage/methylation domain-containing protein